MAKRSRRSKLVFWLLAAVFFAAQAAAFAHELQHDLRQHADASCALHLHAKQATQAAAASAIAAPLVSPTAAPEPAVAPASTPPALGYRTRAPPSFARST